MKFRFPNPFDEKLSLQHWGLCNFIKIDWFESEYRPLRIIWFIQIIQKRSLSLKVKLCTEAITWPPKDYAPLCAIKCIQIVHNIYNDLKRKFVVTIKWSQLAIFTPNTFTQDKAKLGGGWNEIRPEPMCWMRVKQTKWCSVSCKRHRRRLCWMKQ